MSSAILVGLGCFAVALCCAPFRVRFERFLDWIVAPVAVWFGVLSALILVVLLRYSVANHEHAFLYAGLTLQLLGISAVARGISQKLSAFGKTGLRAWVCRMGPKVSCDFSTTKNRRQRSCHRRSVSDRCWNPSCALMDRPNFIARIGRIA